MTTRKRLKRLVRTRAAKTGESYTSALSHFREQSPKERVIMPSPEGRAPARCSFCGKFQDQVKRLIAGPGVFICNECVMLCIDIIVPAEESAEPVASGRREAAPRPASPPLAPDVGAKVRMYVGEAVRRIHADEGVSTPLVEGIDVLVTAEGVRVDVHTPRPATLIGVSGATIDALRSGLAEVVGGHVAVNVVPTPG